MGLGGYLAARGDAEHYGHERLREEREIIDVPDVERREVANVLATYGVTATDAAPLVDALARRPDAWRDFMMRFELGLERPDPRRALTSALTIAGRMPSAGSSPWVPTSC